MDNVSVVDIVDRDSEQNAQVIVRSTKGFIALTLTLEHEGDVQVVMSPAECNKVISRLQQAISDTGFGLLQQEFLEIDLTKNKIGTNHF